MKKFINLFGETNTKKDIMDVAEDFGDLIEAKLIPEGGFDAPLYVMWELTSKCPNQCMYCYNDSHFKRENELSRKRKFEIADSLIKAKVFQVCLTGGEPTCCPEYFDLMRYLRTNGIEIGTILSGANLDKQKIRKIAQYIDMVQISLDGSRAEIHDKVRQREGSFDEAVFAIKEFVALGKQVKVSFATTKYNIDDFANTAELCAKLGVSSLRTQRLSVSGRVKGKEDAIYASEEQFEKLEEYINSKKAPLMIEYRSPSEHVEFGIKNGFATVMRINSEGLVGITPYIDVFFGDLKEESFTEAWNKMKIGWHNEKMLDLAKVMNERENGTLLDPLTSRLYVS
ncbi:MULTISPECIES: radical SAM protein [Pseudobutyrivibrio]|uniref:Radical SAM superfamily enzyme, MoaA/NifB/PqqE/SkfB family n=1 Tax=Pseudobutyrivibrio xylanivorans TaxID=185007 RepID=A0A1G5RXT2_PSEXY|nr:MULTISPECIES: radical SAM protein [Pseudobutyrivibrio]MDC7279316.1 radical SAM protein [Butyrivibrio fibrisolvens]SCZ78912.1 Radical SAM superfamily enzyme, MoaA/NifB/PqqE/SkfB family [Pseudobutyrivibrio xylanivorans]